MRERVILKGNMENKETKMRFQIHNMFYLKGFEKAKY